MATKKNVDPRVLAVVAVLHLVITRLTWRDLRNRPDDRVRGPKTLWRVASALNTSGSLGYWLLGRRRD